MQQRDSFQRQTGLLHKQAGTMPLNRATKPLMDAGTLRAQSEEMLGKARESLENLEARIELLHHACVRANLPVPGLDNPEFKHPLSPKGEQIVGYLTGVFREPESIIREVQVGVFRYYEAVRAVEKVQEAFDNDTLRQEMLEELRLKLFYLTRYHADFKADRVLSQLFPPPQTMAAGAAKPAVMSTVDRLKQKQARDAVLHKAEILRASLQPKMEIVRLTLEMLENPKGFNIGALFTPSTRTARLLALGLGGATDVIDQLRQARELYGQLDKELTAARNGGEVEQLKQVIYPLGRLAVDCSKHPMLRDVFPLGEQDLFPTEEAPPPATPGA
ncbi:MAG: hypothetical protein JWM80_4668 [Cyanobacteria bacterium RYN_339]|nr:hypothetical protein [Cyanobacteria bacterium RYN_339]